MKKVSVVIPNYNQGHVLPMTVDWVFQQSYPNLEIIIVDGGSNDETKDYLKGLPERIREDQTEFLSSVEIFSEEDSRFERQWGPRYPQEGRELKIITFPSDIGATETLNEGMSRITGEYCTYVVGDDLPHLSMIEEAVEIGNRSEIAVQFSHLAITDRRVYGHGPQMLNLFEQARTNGLDITYDVYPYTAAGAGLDQTIPLWAQTGGIDGLIDRLQDTKTRVRIRNEVAAGLGGLTPQWETWVVSYLPQGSDPGEVGLSVKEIALRRGIEAAEAVLQLTEESRATVSGVIHNRIESDVRLFLSHPLAMIGSDGTAVSPDGVYAGEPLHPRFYGTHPRILGRYVREQSLMSLETAVHKMTGMPAERLNLKDRGLVSEGLTADLAIFDPCQVTDHATFEDPHQLSEGVLHVLVNGRKLLTRQCRKIHGFTAFRRPCIITQK